jgi:uncharacterized protein with von Willebrand factor type A (vWA) domain
MKAERDLISFFYVGKNETEGKYLMPKIGETKQKLKKRERDIRSHHAEDKNFRMLGALTMINATQAERRLVESYVRVKMEQYGKNIKNDHFLIRARAKKYREGQYTAFAIIALGYAVECCEKEHFLYLK